MTEEELMQSTPKVLGVLALLFAVVGLVTTGYPLLTVAVILLAIARLL